jgi:signal transduction histidine kinase
MARHVSDVVSAEGLEPDLADSAYRVLSPAREDVALVVLAATALDDRDLEIVALLRESSPAATVLVLFPPNLRERAARALELGADATLPEPFYPAELAAHAQRAAARYAHLRAGGSPASAPSAPPAAPVDDDGPPAAVPPADGTNPVEQIAVGVAHSIRNPLQILELMLSTAETGDELDIPAVRRLLTRMANVVEDLTRFGARARVEPVDVDLPALIGDVFAPSRRRGAPRFEIESEHSLTELTVRGVPDLLRTALQIARDRAVRETPRGGRVRVSARRDGDRVEVRIADAGPTPPPEELARFFLPDPDTDAVQAGTWLEMAALAGMIRNQGADPGRPPPGGGRVVIRPRRRERRREPR